MTKEPKLTELRRIAEAATQGKWQIVNYDSDASDPYKRVAEFDYEGDIYAETKINFPDDVAANKKHIATFSPSTVLKLLDKIERYEKALKTLRVAVEDKSPDKGAVRFIEEALKDG